MGSLRRTARRVFAGALAISPAGMGFAAGPAASPAGPELSALAPERVMADLRRANAFFANEHPDPALDIVTERKRPEGAANGPGPAARVVHPSNIWTRGVYYEGLMALRAVDPEPGYATYALTWAVAHRWGLRGGAGTRNADDQCCGQTYLQLYSEDPQAVRIHDIRASIDGMVASPRSNDWTWVDAIQMSMPVYAKLGALTGDARYYEKMYALFLFARDGTGKSPALYNAKAGLWWRDGTFVPPYKEPNGADCYWSRGNGWAMAALVRVLDGLPPEAPGRSDYVTMLRQMAGAVKALQRPDGFWNVSLADPGHYGGPELTGTALFTYGLAAGIREGILPAEDYRAVIGRAWSALATGAIHADGRLGYVQGTGKEPSDGQPVSYDSRPDFDDFGVGCFLLGGSEVLRMARAGGFGR